jgi:P4 family phage/plasmid primase-like protien
MFSPIDSAEAGTREERVRKSESQFMRERPEKQSVSRKRTHQSARENEPTELSTLKGQASADQAQQGLPVSVAKKPDYFSLEIGSDVEIFQRIRDRLNETYGRVVYAEGQVWYYSRTHWQAFLEHDLRKIVQEFDGARYPTPSGSLAWVKLGKGKINSILHELLKSIADPEFFEKRVAGINCASGFIQFDENGSPKLGPHSPEYRARHMLAGSWTQNRPTKLPADSLLSRLLGGVFKGDSDSSEKQQLLAEICGVAALGHAVKLVQPRAVLLYGALAENGKGQIIDLMRGLLPESAVCSVAPAIMSDERHVIALAGKLLNATDELSAAAIASNRFKSIITGDPVSGRDVYKSRVEFRPIGQHVFASNKLPPFRDGMDRGVQRRLCVIPFNRVIPIEERIEGIGKLVARREPDLLLGWAVQGASRALRQGIFTIPSSCRQALREWIFAADPVPAWLEERVQVDSGGHLQNSIKTRAAYNEFRTWAAAEGFRSLPDINGFVQRVMSTDPRIEHRRSGKAGRRFIGMRIRPAEER